MCEIKQFPEVEKMCPQELAAKDLVQNGGKTYQIELTGVEAEFIKDTLMGIDEFTQFLNGYFDSVQEFERGNIQLRPGEIADKIFCQCHDGNGGLL